MNKRTLFPALLILAFSSPVIARSQDATEDIKQILLDYNGQILSFLSGISTAEDAEEGKEELAAIFDSLQQRLLPYLADRVAIGKAARADNPLYRRRSDSIIAELHRITEEDPDAAIMIAPLLDQQGEALASFLASGTDQTREEELDELLGIDHLLTPEDREELMQEVIQISDTMNLLVAAIDSPEDVDSLQERFVRLVDRMNDLFTENLVDPEFSEMMTEDPRLLHLNGRMEQLQRTLRKEHPDAFRRLTDLFDALSDRFGGE